MGVDSRPARSSRNRAKELLSSQQRDQQNLDLEGEFISRPHSPRKRRKLRKSKIHSSEEEDGNHLHLRSNQYPESPTPLMQSTTREDAKLSDDDSSQKQLHSQDSKGSDASDSDKDNDVDLDGNFPDDISSESPSDDMDDEDFQKPPRLSLPVRLPLTHSGMSKTGEGIVLKSGRISNPPKRTTPGTNSPLRRKREEKPSRDVLYSREARYKRRSRLSEGSAHGDLHHGEERDAPVSQSRHLPRRHNRSLENGSDQIEEDEETLMKGYGSSPEQRQSRRSSRVRRSRVVRMVDLENRRLTRNSSRLKAEVNAADLDEMSYVPITRARRRSINGVGKSGQPIRNNVGHRKMSDVEEEADGDGDYHTPVTDDDSEEQEEAIIEEDELDGGPRDGGSDDDFVKVAPTRRHPLRHSRKAQPRRSVPPKRKRARERVDRNENSMARETLKSFRPRKESLRPSSFYQDADPSSEESVSSDDSRPAPRVPRPRAAARQAGDAIADAVQNVDFLKNPMAIIEGGKGARPIRSDRYSRRRSRLRPSRPDPFASDGDDGGATAAPIEPEQVDLNLSWEDIGGLDHHIRALKEMVFLPLMYPEVFEKFHMEAPKGVLFYGPPGTGKTLCARALAASCGSDPQQTPITTLNTLGSVLQKAPVSDGAGVTEKSTEPRENGKPIGSISNVVNVVPSEQKEETRGADHASRVNKISSLIDTPDHPMSDVQMNEGQSFSTADPYCNVKETPLPATNINTEMTPGKSLLSCIEPPVSPTPVKKKPRVAFFMRNGADCLSKWVGEAERQLRMTFEAAKEHEPAIIFFDEIDGLAPVRSSRQDQIHSSIVSTLLGLMDGLDARGKIVVIGATNRVDAIDPALRRPGRFDRELIFTLPNLTARRKILSIHTSKWKPPPRPELLEAVAKMTVGYCGADLKSLCSEAAIRALRRRYPQIYESQDKLVIDIDQVRVSSKDFLMAMKEIIPASHRSAKIHARPIPDRLEAVLTHPLRTSIFMLDRIFPHGKTQGASIPSNSDYTDGILEKASEKDVSDEVISSSDDEGDLNVSEMQSRISNAGKMRPTGLKSSLGQQHSIRPRILICGQQGLGQAQLGPALLHYCEGCPVHAIDYPSLHADAGARSAEEALISAFREAARSVPSVLYLPHIQLWWDSAPQSLRTTLIIALKDIPSDLPLLVLATAEAKAEGLPSEVTELFGEILELSSPSEDQRRKMFLPLIDAAKARPKLSSAAARIRRKQRVEEVLEKAPPPAPKLPTAEELSQKIHSEDRSIRILRMEMRAFVEGLLRDKKFKAFWNPVDPESAPDYYDIIEIPMDISKIAAQVDLGRYPTVLAMVNDFDIMVKNAIQYNPPNTEIGAAILRRAHGLIDLVHAWVDNLSPSLIETCNKIIADRISRAQQQASEQQVAGYGELTDPIIEKPGENRPIPIMSNPVGRLSPLAPNNFSLNPIGSSWIGGIRSRESMASKDRSLSVAREKRSMGLSKFLGSGRDLGVDEVLVEANPGDVARLERLIINISTGMTVDGLEGLYVKCEQVVQEQKRSLDREKVLKMLINTVELARDDLALVGKLVE